MNGMRWLKILMRRRARKHAEAHAGEAFRYVSLRFKGEEEIPDDLQFSVAEDASETEKKGAAASEKSRPRVSYSLRDQPKAEQERDGKADKKGWICRIGCGTVVYRDEPYEDFYSWVCERKPAETFSAAVIRMMNERGMKPGVFCRKSGMDRKLFSKLKTDERYQPNKVTAIRCCLALELAPDDAVTLLKCAGYALSDTSEFDLAIRYCLEHGIYDLMTVSELLFMLNVRVM